LLFECATIKDVAQLINTRFFPSDEAEGCSPGALLVRGGGAALRGSLQLLSLLWAGAMLVASLVLPVRLCGWALAQLLTQQQGQALWLARVLVLPPLAYALHVLAVLCLCLGSKWVLVGRYRAGAHRTDSLFFVRWLAVERVVALASRTALPAIKGTALHALWLRAMGVRGRGLPAVDSEFVSEFDLLTLGGQATVQAGARLRGAVVEVGGLKWGGWFRGLDGGRFLAA
jgi:hypothetical protein